MIGRLLIMSLYLFSMLNSTVDSPASNNTVTGQLMLTATIQSIGIVAPFSGDDNQNNFASLQYRPIDSPNWMIGHQLYADRSSRQWRGSIVSLSPDKSYEIEVLFTDPDGVSPSSQLGVIQTRPEYPEVGNGGTVRYVPDNGNLQAVINASSPGDTIRLRQGIYNTSAYMLPNNSGAPGQYITIEADPGSFVALDGSDPSINAHNIDNWIQYPGTNIYYTDLPWSTRTCNTDVIKPNYVGELNNGDSVRFLLFNHGSSDWNTFVYARPGKAYYSCDSVHTLGRLYITTFEGDDPDNHDIQVSQYYTGLSLLGADYIRIRNIEFRYYSYTAIELREPDGIVDPGADNNIIEGNVFHGNRFGVYIGQGDKIGSAHNIIQNNNFYERGYKDSGWTWDTMYHYAPSIGVKLDSAQSGNVIRFNQFVNGTDAVDVHHQSFDTDVYNNLIEDCMDDGIEVDNEPGYNIRIWGNTIRNCLDGISTQDWFKGNYWNVGPIYVFRNLITGGRDPQGRRDSDGKVYSSGYAFKVGSSINDNGIGRVYLYHNTISIPDSPLNGNGIQDAGGYYFSGIISRNNIYNVSRRTIQFTSPETIGGHSFDYDNIHQGALEDDKLIRWSNAGGPAGNGEYSYLSSFRAYTGQELGGISNTNTLFNSDYTLQAGSPEINAGCVISGFNDRYPWLFSGSAPDIGAFEYDSGPVLTTFLPVINR